MQPNNNPITEIGVILVSLAFIAAGTVVFVLGKVDLTGMTSILLLAAGVFGGNLVLKAPSPAQQAALLSLASQVLSQQAQPAQLVQAPAPVAQPQIVPTLPQNMTAAAQRVDYTTSINPQMVNAPVQQLPFPAAINTTLSQPVVKP